MSEHSPTTSLPPDTSSTPGQQMTSTTASTAQPQGNPLLTVLRDQRKTLGLAVVMIVASYWIAGQLGEWTLAGCIAGGVALGLVNHLATELWLLRTIRSGEEMTRRKMAAATFVRLLVLTVVAVGIAVAFWPDGIGLLLGLAIFRLIALVMTGIPLLRELNKELKTP